MASTINKDSNSIVEHLEEGKDYELEFGETWNSTNDFHSSKYSYHTIKYDFKPASVIKSDQAELTVGEDQDVTITIPNVEGSASQSTKFSGSTKSYQPKECLMIIDPRTGKIVLERLSANIRVKNVRGENRNVNPLVKPPVVRPPVATETTTNEKKLPKPTKPNVQPTVKPTKPSTLVSVKPTTTTTTKTRASSSSPFDDRLSDEETYQHASSSRQSNFNAIVSHSNDSESSHRVLAEDLHLSDTSDEEN